MWSVAPDPSSGEISPCVCYPNNPTHQGPLRPLMRLPSEQTAVSIAAGPEFQFCQGDRLTTWAIAVYSHTAGSHELHTPLTTVGTLTQAATEHCDMSSSDHMSSCPVEQSFKGEPKTPSDTYSTVPTAANAKATGLSTTHLYCGSWSTTSRTVSSESWLALRTCWVGTARQGRGSEHTCLRHHVSWNFGECKVMPLGAGGGA